MNGAESHPEPSVSGTDALQLAVSDDAGPTLPAQEIVTGRGLVAGVSGAGKSNTATVVAEEILDLGIPVVVLDPEGEFVALAEDYPVVVFGEEPEADVHGDPDDANALAARAVAERVPVVFDLSGLPEERAERTAAAVANGLFRAESQHEVPLLFIVDELDEFLPETAKTVATKPLTRVAQRGRKRGLGMLGASQRPADVSKDFITQAEYHVWHRLRWENDLDVAANHLPDEHAADLGAFDDGEVVLDTDWTTAPQRFSFRLKTVSDLGATPSISQSVGSVPETAPAAFLEGSDAEPADDAATCADCPFCRENVDPPAHLADAVSAADGDVLAVYRVQELADDSYRATIRERAVESLGLSPGDTVALEIGDDELRLVPGGNGLVEYDVSAQHRLTLSGRALSLLAVEAGDHVQVVDHGDRVTLRRVTARPDAPPSPVLATVTPYCQKTADDRADSAQLPTAVPTYLGVQERIGVRHDDGNVSLTDPADADLSYVVQDGCPTLGAKGLRPLDARDGDTIILLPDDDEIRVTVARDSDGGSE